MFKCRNPLSFDDRKKIQHGIRIQFSYAEIAMSINRVKSVIQREVKRFAKVADYDAQKAQKNFESKQKLSGIKRNSELYIKIEEQESLNEKL